MPRKPQMLGPARERIYYLTETIIELDEAVGYLDESYLRAQSVSERQNIARKIQITNSQRRRIFAMMSRHYEPGKGTLSNDVFADVRSRDAA